MPLHWNQAAEDLLHQILQRTPRPVRDQTEANLLSAAAAWAEDNGLNRIGIQAVIAAYIQITPEALRSELPHQFEALGLDESDYRHLLEA